MIAADGREHGKSFAGSFVAQGFVHAGFTAELEAHAAALGNARGEHARHCVVFRAQHPLAELRHLARQIVDDANRHDDLLSVSGAGVNVRQNQVRITLDEWDAAAVAVLRDRYGSDRVALEVRHWMPAAEAEPPAS